MDRRRTVRCDWCGVQLRGIPCALAGHFTDHGLIYMLRTGWGAF